MTPEFDSADAGPGVLTRLKVGSVRTNELGELNSNRCSPYTLSDPIEEGLGPSGEEARPFELN